MSNLICRLFEKHLFILWDTQKYLLEFEFFICANYVHSQ